MMIDNGPRLSYTGNILGYSYHKLNFLRTGCSVKYSVFTVSTPEFAPKQILPHLKRIGYDGVEWRVAKPDGENLCAFDAALFPKQAKQAKELTESFGLEICALGTYLNDSPIDEVEAMLRAAAEIAVPRIRVSPAKYKPEKHHYRDMFQTLVERYAALEPLARKYGVKIDIELHHGSILCSATAAYRLLRRFDPGCIGAIYDMGNAVYEGYEQYSMAIECLGEYLDHVHLKNTRTVRGERDGFGTVRWRHEAAPMWDGVGDTRLLLAALKKSGYDGYLSFEDFSQEQPCLTRLEENLNYVKALAGTL